jgi:superfamily II DNA or RNA helicase
MSTFLRPYQKEGFDSINEAWLTNDLIMFVLATGGGKTVTFIEIIKQLLREGKRIMLIAHREELIKQAWNTLYRNSIYAGIIKSGNPEKFDLPVQICSIQTIARRKILPPTDVLIIDEGHHATKDNSYGQIIARFSSAKVLLVTATPYRLSGEGFRYLHSYKETKLIINRTLEQLTEEGWLVPLRYYAASIPDLDSIKTDKGEYLDQEAKKAMELAPLVESYLQYAKGMQGICFAVNVQHSIEIAGQYWRAGIPAEHIDANTPEDERNRILSDFRAGLVKAVCNVGIITEGSDFPNCEFVQLAKPTKSLSLYGQMIGRNTRPDYETIQALNFIASAEERRAKIASSKKPFGVILDNAGCLIDHLGPYWKHDWNRYFIGTKKEKKQPEETFEMLVYVVEDQAGNRKRTTKIEEVEGKRLIEITTEHARKLINITSIKEFDRLYSIMKHQPKIKKPGYVAFKEFIKYCNQKNFLMTDEIWIYLKRALVDDITEKVQLLQENRSKFPNAYPEAILQESIDKIYNQGISLTYLKAERGKYEKENQAEVLRARFGSKVV